MTTIFSFIPLSCQILVGEPGKKWVKKPEQNIFTFSCRYIYLHNTLTTENNCCLNSKYGNQRKMAFSIGKNVPW